MSAFGQWLLHEDQNELFDTLYAALLSVVFYGLAALALWPLGAAPFAWGLWKGYWVFCVMVGWTAFGLYLFRRIFRIDIDTRFDAYVISALAVSGFVQAGWCAFAALALRGAAASASWPVAAALAFFGFLSCYVSAALVAVYYSGQLYRYFNVPFAGAAFVLFAVWPAAARFLYGWFFELF